MKRRNCSTYLMCILRALPVIVALSLSIPARADHVITQDGKALFNVIVDDVMSTWSRPLKVRYRAETFGYNYDSNSVFMPAGRGEFYWVGDFIKTSEFVAKEQARELMRKRKWDVYEPPPPVTIVPFTPAPVTPTPEPTQIVGEGELADQSLPIGDRVQQQLEKFIAQQKELAAQIEFAVKVQNFKPEKGKEMRVQLLDRQIKILKQYYNQSENLVQKAMEALVHQRETVMQKGTYTHELMHDLGSF